MSGRYIMFSLTLPRQYGADFPDTGPHGFGGRLGMTFLFPTR